MRYIEIPDAPKSETENRRGSQLSDDLATRDDAPNLDRAGNTTGPDVRDGGAQIPVLKNVGIDAGSD